MRNLILPILMLAATVAAGDEPQSKPKPRGDRVLGIDVNEPAGADFGACFALARGAGSHVVELSVHWSDFETAPGVYKPKTNWLAIANAYYPAQKIPLHLVLAPIDTNNKKVPADLKKVPFDDPRMIKRFLAWIDWVLTQIPDTKILTLSVGNEIDGYLSGAEQYARYETFYKAARAHLKKARPKWIVGTKGMWSGLTKPGTAGLMKKLNAHSDGIFVTYYPLKGDFGVKPPEQFGKDVEAIVDAYPKRPIYFLEAGCPSSAVLGSSEKLQARFVTEMFRAWDAHADRIRAMQFTWLHDISQASLDHYKKYYRLDNPRFLAYLGSLGLRTHAGKGRDKLAFETLRREAKARGW